MFTVLRFLPEPMKSEIDPSGKAAVKRLLDEHVCATAVYLPETASTNTLAIHQVRSEAMDSSQLPRLVLADQQTGGRGRMGRQWESDDGTLTFSLVVEAGTMETLPLAVGVGIARAIDFEFAPLMLRLKWPNDLILGDSKLGGILCEAVQESTPTPSGKRRVIVGVGLNVSSAPDFVGPDVPPAISLSQHVGRPIKRYGVLFPIVSGILSTLSELENAPESVLGEFRSRCWLSGQLIRFTRGNEPMTGRCLGIDPTGHLRVQTQDTILTLGSGDVQRLRPA
ncbi:biotin--[acetyl-CoA-carboxylase] ligase [Crateriforma conspicua]|uniref:biotin--[biotin carboxyl-carrier protein] ligase n=2 Tax=Crateriforma conspicua TaxID=2527996 RepID=A0A5C5YBG8_9PLAN|nr:biotin--[acetyl-CoA-carboxylase] ligase [Crateriforma conspicua]QDV62166.1 Bifunctional ligase/repressor BirA [Crateriforma conspicua]TWT71665.1 Bifunctional ligase/repressor BirA [Crateriforma conspicua]